MRRAFYLLSVFLLGNVMAGPAIAADKHEEHDETPPPKAKATHRIMSCNIRTPKDVDRASGNGWEDRREFCLEVIRKHSPDVICFQECTEAQYIDLVYAFPSFKAYAIFPGQYHLSSTAGNVIFFGNRYELVSSSSYWLSESPGIPNSRGWDAKYPRFVNWVRLKDKISGIEFRVANTHFDHKGEKARVESAKLISADFAAYPDSYAQVLVGDLNSNDREEPVNVLKAAGLADTFSAVNGNTDPGFTAHDFFGEEFANPKQWRKIDWIFARGNVEVRSSAIIKDKKGSKYPSDHFFLLSEIALYDPTGKVTEDCELDSSFRPIVLQSPQSGSRP